MAGEVSFQPTEQDYIAANRDWMRRSIGRPYRTGNSALISVFVIIAGLLVLIACAQVPSLAPYVDGVFGLAGYVVAGGLAGWAICLLASYLLLPRRARRLFRQQARLEKPLRYIWSDAGIGWRAPNGASNIAWEELYRWSSGPRTFLFLINERIFYFIPRRTLTDEQAEDLRATVSASGLEQF